MTRGNRRPSDEQIQTPAAVLLNYTDRRVRADALRDGEVELDMSSWQDLRDSFLRFLEEGQPRGWLSTWRLIVEHPWYRQQLKLIAARVLRSRGAPLDWREDLEHDCILLLAQKLQKKPDLGVDPDLVQTHFAGWLATIITNHCLDVLRRQARYIGLRRELPEQLTAGPRRATQEAFADLSVAMDRLDDQRRTVLLLYAKGLSLTRIAADLGLDYSKTCRLFRSGLEELRRIL